MGKILSLLGLCAALGCYQISEPAGAKSQPGQVQSSDPADDQGEHDERISLDDVPAHVKQAAQNEVPGIVLEAAERETENGTLLYDLVGTANGTRYEIEVTEAGKIGEVERGDDEAEDDGADEDR